jgi:hypothetical protein
LSEVLVKKMEEGNKWEEGIVKSECFVSKEEENESDSEGDHSDSSNGEEEEECAEPPAKKRSESLKPT